MLKNPGLRKSVEQPVLDLNFAASQIGSNAAPDSRIDFSRGTNAWFVDSDGLVKKSPHNLLLRSEELDNASWTKEATANITANAAAAPDGSLTADQYFASASSGFARVSQTPTGVVDGQTYTYSVFVKANGYDYFLIRSKFRGSSANDNVAFDLSDGTISYEATGYTGFITDEGNGWFRVGFTVEAGSSGGVSGHTFLRFQPTEQTSNSISAITGDGSSGGYIWGAQTSQHTILPVDNPYIKTEGSAVYAAKLDHDASWFMSAAQEQNLLEYSEMLDNSGWTKTRASVTANATTAPDGTTTAEKLYLDSTNSTSHFAIQNNEILPGVKHTFSVYLKADDLTHAHVSLINNTSPFEAIRIAIDLSDGSTGSLVVGNGASSGSFNVTDDGDGWYRVEVSGIIGSSDTAWGVVYLAESTSTFVVATGDGSSGLFVWGAQLEVGSTASTYHRTEGQPYYGEGATPKGLLIEEARTNTVTYSEDFSQSIYTKTGVTATDNSVLSPSGEVTGAFIAETSATSNHNLTYFWTIDANETLTVSYFIKKAGRDKLSLQNYGPGSIAGGEYVNFDYTFSTNSFGTAGAGGNTTLVSRSATDYGNGWVRIAISITYSGGTSGSGSWRIYATDGSGTSYAGDTSKGFYVWGAQVEEAANSFPTSYIKTTGSTATRNADVATMGPTTGGTELVTNGTFDTDTSNWTVVRGATLSVSSGQLTVAGDAQYGSGAIQGFSTVAGRRYRASFDIVSVSASNAGRVSITNFSDDAGSVFADATSLNAGNGQTLDFTAEQATSYIVVRAQNPSTTVVYDNVSLRELYPFEQYNPSEGTMYAEADLQHDATIMMFNQDGATSPRMEVQVNGSGILNPVITNSSGTATLSHNLGSYTAGADLKVGFALQQGNYASSDDGDNVVSGAGSDMASVDEFSLGSRRGISRYMNGHLKRVSYYSRRLPDETLESLTDD